MPAAALHSSRAYSVLRVDSTMARSLTGPEARVSINTRDSTAGDAAMASMASGWATASRTPIQCMAQYTVNSVRPDSSTLCTSTMGL